MVELVFFFLVSHDLLQATLTLRREPLGEEGGLIIMNSELYLMATGLVILESENLNKLFPNFMVKFGTLLVHGRKAFVLITAVVILPSMLLTDSSILSYVSRSWGFFLPHNSSFHIFIKFFSPYFLLVLLDVWGFMREEQIF